MNIYDDLPNDGLCDDTLTRIPESELNIRYTSSFMYPKDKILPSGAKWYDETRLDLGKFAESVSQPHRALKRGENITGCLQVTNIELGDNHQRLLDFSMLCHQVLAEVFPGRPRSCYRLIPYRQCYCIVDRDKPEMREQFADWNRKSNQAIEQLGGLVTHLTPSFYTPANWDKSDATLERDFAKWCECFGYQINFLRERLPDKPLFPYISWMRKRHDPAKKDLVPIRLELWERQLDFLRDKVDGVVVWRTCDQSSGFMEALKRLT